MLAMKPVVIKNVTKNFVYHKELSMWELRGTNGMSGWGSTKDSAETALLFSPVPTVAK